MPENIMTPEEIIALLKKLLENKTEQMNKYYKLMQNTTDDQLRNSYRASYLPALYQRNILLALIPEIETESKILTKILTVKGSKAASQAILQRFADNIFYNIICSQERRILYARSKPQYWKYYYRNRREQGATWKQIKAYKK